MAKPQKKTKKVVTNPEIERLQLMIDLTMRASLEAGEDTQKGFLAQADRFRDRIGKLIGDDYVKRAKANL